MIKHYIFIISTNNQSVLTVGRCTDLKKAVSFYKGLPNLSDKPKDFNKLVYLEEHPHEQSAIDRFNEVSWFSKEVKEAIIESINPTYFDLVPGKNFEL